MRNASGCIAAPHSDHPLPEDRSVDQGIAPKYVAEVGKVSREISGAVMRNESDRALHQRAEIVVHRLQMQALQVGNVAVYVERENLPRASFQYLVATEPAVEHEAALAWAVSFAGDVVVGPHLADGDWKRENRRRFLAGQRGNAFELSKQRIGVRDMCGSPCKGGSATGLSATGA